MDSDQAKIDKVTHALTGKFFIGQRVRVTGDRFGTVVPNDLSILGLATNSMHRYVRVDLDKGGGKWHFPKKSVSPL